MTARSARRRFLLLTVLRWLPVGLYLPVLVLLLTDRGLSLAQIGLVTAAQGVLVLLLELPTGGLADALGRRPLLITATLVNLVSTALLLVAGTVPLLLLVFALQGVYRALDSGPLEAWYVDTALAADPQADIEAGLGSGSAALGISIAAGSLASGGLVALDLLPAVSPLTVPLLVSLAVMATLLVAQALLLVEPDRMIRTRSGPGRFTTALASLRAAGADVPAVVGSALRLVRAAPALAAIIAVELFWGFGMTAFETLRPPRLAEVAGGRDVAAALLGPAGAAAWLGFAGAAALAPRAARWIGPFRTAAGLRLLQGVTVAGMGLLAGPVGVLAAYVATFAVHGASNPVHVALLHRRVTAEHRTTVLSLNSMVARPGGALGGIALGALADASGLTTAIMTGAAVLAVAAPLYLVAARTDAAAPMTGADLAA